MLGFGNTNILYIIANNKDTKFSLVHSEIKKHNKHKLHVQFYFVLDEQLCQVHKNQVIHTPSPFYSDCAKPSVNDW